MLKKYKLLVEGKDDQYVLESIFRQNHISIQQIEIKLLEGINNLSKVLELELKESYIERVGIVIDADTDINSRWQMIVNILKKIGYKDVPRTPDPNETIIHPPPTDDIPEISYPLPIIGIWIMPDNKLPGILENFIQFLVPEGDKLLERAKSCVSQIPPDQKLFKNDFIPKAEIHTWLAWQEEPGTPLGQAITKRYLDSEVQEVENLIDWISRLFVESELQ